MIERAKYRWRRYLALFIPASALLVPVLLWILYPNTWRPYITYSLARLGWPLVGLFLVLILLALLLVAFLRYRRKSELLAACLILSIALHMLTVSMFSLLLVKQRIYELVQEAEKYDLSVGRPSLIESLVSQAVRGKLLDMELADAHKFEAQKTRSKLVEATVSRLQPEAPDPALLEPTHEDMEIEQISKPEQKVEEKLEALQEKWPEVTTMKIAVIDQVEVQREDRASRETEVDEMELELTQADKLLDVLPEPAQRPNRPELKEVIRAPTHEEIEIVAERIMKHEIEDTIKDVVIDKTMDLLELPVGEVSPETRPMETEGETVWKPKDEFHWSRPAGTSPEVPLPTLIALEIEDTRAKISSASLADADLEYVERRPEVDSSVMTTFARTSHRTEPVRIKDTLATAARGTLAEQSSVSEPFVSEDLDTDRREGLFTDDDGYIERPVAEIEVSAKPLGAETLLKPVMEEIARLRSEIPELSEGSYGQELLAESAILERREEKTDMEIVVGSLDVRLEQEILVETKGVGEVKRELVRLQVDKARPELKTEVSEPARFAFETPDKVFGAGSTLVQTDIRPLTDVKMPEAIETEPVIAGAVSKTHKPVLLMITAQAAEPGKEMAGEYELTGTDPMTSVHVTKDISAAQLVDETPLAAPEAGAIDTGAAGRMPLRMSLHFVDTAHVELKVPTEISAADTRGEEHKLLISVGVTHPLGPVSKKAIYKLRVPEKRRQFIEELGGSLETEEAVEQALKWLGKTQSDDGRWDVDGFKLLADCGGAGDRKDGDVAVTGLSLLAYLGAGYMHTEGEHKETVRKALDWLLAGQKGNGDLRRGGQMYGQAMATAALCEAYSMTRDKRLLPAAERAVKFIQDAQNPGAGWRYQPQEDNDTSVAGWQVLALKSAEIAGVKVPKRHYEWLGLWLDKVRKGEEGGLYSYKPGDPATHVMTAEGWFCQLFMSEDIKMRGVSESIDCIMKNLPQWAPDSGEVPHLYYWYYATLSLHLSGVQEFARWNEALSEALLKGRVKDGVAAGSWDPVCQLGTRGGRIYSTAMSTLCLEVYYRYLPFYKQE